VTSEFDVDELRELPGEPAVPARRSAIQLMIAAVVLAIALLAALLGGAAVITQVLPTGGASDDYDLAAVETLTGFTFPEGSVLIESSSRGGSLRYPHERSVSAVVRMPAGSALPTSDDPLSSITPLSPDENGDLIVEVTTSNGLGPPSV
jgi:hypothetical protein